MKRFVEWILKNELLCCAVLAVIGYKVMGVMRLLFALVLFVLLRLLVFKRRPSETGKEQKAPRRNLLKPMAASMAVFLVITGVCYFQPVGQHRVEYTAAEAVEMYSVDEIGGFTIELPESMRFSQVRPAAGTDVVFAVESHSQGLELEIDVYETSRDFEHASDQELIAYARKVRHTARGLSWGCSSDIIDIGAKRFVRYQSSFFGMHALIYVTEYDGQGFMVSVFSDDQLSDSEMDTMDQIVASIRFPDM